MIMIKYGDSILVMRLISIKKISAPRVDPSQTLVPFSVQVMTVGTELLSSLQMSYYTFSYIKNTPITKQTRTRTGQFADVGALTHYMGENIWELMICCLYRHIH